MSVLTQINPRFIVNLDKFTIGLPNAEEWNTKGNFILFRESMSIDTLWDECECTITNEDFVKSVIGVFSDTYAQEEKEMLEFAIQHKIRILDVDGYKEYLNSTESPMSGNEWVNDRYNKMWNTQGKVYVNCPSDSYFAGLKKATELGEYRLGVFIN